MRTPSHTALCQCLLGVLVLVFAGCATDNKPQAAAPAVVAPAPVPELPAPNKPILVLDSDTNQSYEILGEVTAVLKDQRVYNYEGSKDDAREYLKRTAFAKYGDRLDAIINYRSATIIGGGGFWGAVGAAYGAKNTDVQTSGIAVQFKKQQKK